MPISRTPFLGVDFDRLTMNDVLDRLGRVTAQSPYGYLVTPNVDHVIRLNQATAPATLASAYKGADYCLCDSRVLRQIARLQHIDLSVVTGSDLTIRVLNEIVRPGDRVAIVGGDNALVQALSAHYPDIFFVHNCPPMGLAHSAAARDATARFIATAGARFALIAVGSPQQEMIAAQVRAFPDARGMALCIGASLDFIVGRQRRAPRILQQLSLEWAYRLSTQPRRMWRRYLVDGPRIFRLAARYRRSGSGH